MNFNYNHTNDMQNSKPLTRIKAPQLGFTLMELMIALVLGLLISAAAVQVYIVNFQTTTIQQSSSDIQDASIFGIQQLESHLRLANLGNDVTHINDETIDGGIVLTGLNMHQYKLKSDGSIDLDSGKLIDVYNDIDYLTRSANDIPNGDDNGWTGISNTNIKSDQLTIQFKNVSDQKMYDCEGDSIEPKETAIERYYLRDDSKTNDLVLACDAGRVIFDETTKALYKISSDFGESGQTFIRGVDQFTVLLGSEYTNPKTSTSKVGQMMYLPSNTYMQIKDKDASNLSLSKPPITSVKVGLIMHGSTTILGSDSQTDFKVLGQNNELKETERKNKRMRTTFEITTLLRNARIINVKKGS